MPAPDQLDLSDVQWLGDAGAKQQASTAKDTREEAKAARDAAKDARDAALAPERARLAAAQATALETKNKSAAEAKAAEAATHGAAQGSFRDNLLVALQQLDRARHLAAATTTGYGSLLKDVPGSRAKELQAAIQAVRGNTFLATLSELKSGNKGGSTGMGRILQSEVPFFVDRFGKLDQARDASGLVATADDIENSLRRMYARVNGDGPLLDSADPKERARAMQTYGLTEPGQPRAAPVAAPQPRELMKPGEQTSAAVPADMQRQYEAYVQQHGADLKPDEYVQFRTGLDKVYGYGEADAGKLAAYQAEAKRIRDMYARGQTPNLQIAPVNAAATSYEQMRAAAQQNPLVGRLAATAAGAAQSGAGPLMGLTGDDYRAKLAALQEAHPEWAAGGKLADAVALAGMGQRAGLNPTAVNAAQGAWSGAGENPDDMLPGAIYGGVTGAALGKAGEGASTLARGAKGLEIPLLQKYGVPVTVGDITGGLARRAENAIAKVPFVGAPMRARQAEAIGPAFNKAALDEVLAPLNLKGSGAIGQQGLAETQDLVSNGFGEALRNVRLPNSSGLVDKVDQTLTSLEASDPAAARALRARFSPILSKPELDGNDVQRFLQDANDVGSAFKDNPGWAVTVRPAVNDMRDAMVNHLEQGGFGANNAMLKDANAAYGRLKIVEDSALHHQLADGSELFTPETLHRTALEHARQFQGEAAAARGQTRAGVALPMLNLAKEGLRLSGSANTSMALPAGLGAVGLGDLALRYGTRDPNDHSGDFAAHAVRDTAVLAGLGLAPAIVGSSPVQNVARKLLLDAPADASGSWLRRALAKYTNAGAAGAAALARPNTERFAPTSKADAQVAQLPLPSSRVPPGAISDLAPDIQPQTDAFGQPLASQEDAPEEPLNGQ